MPSSSNQAIRVIRKIKVQTIDMVENNQIIIYNTTEGKAFISLFARDGAV